MSSYQATLDYLYSRLPMFSRIGAAAIKADLDNTLALCKQLGQPQNKFKTIHVAGTNGKGSTSHMLAALFQEAGYKTGLYTSPHLYDFRERIKVNGEMCSKEFVTSFTNKIKPFIEQVQPSFFEITVGMAFEYFATEQVDIAIIETGLGGRLDSTNIIHPELSIITNIGWDHMALLGNTLSQIAAEKAGIIKAKVPIVISESIPESKSIFEQKSVELKAPIYFAESILSLKNYEHHWTHSNFEFTSLDNLTPSINLSCDLPGQYQFKNMRGVLVAVSILNTKGWKLNEEVVKKAFMQIKSSTGLMGRWECIQTNPAVVLDVAHNEHGLLALLAQLESLTYNHLHIVTGMVKDKDVDAVLQLLPKNASYYFTQSSIPRALPANVLAEKAASYFLQGHVFENVNLALTDAKKNSQATDLILVIGSIFLVAEVNRP